MAELNEIVVPVRAELDESWGELLSVQTEPDMVITADAPVALKARLIGWASRQGLPGGDITRVAVNGPTVEVTVLLRDGQRSLFTEVFGIDLPDA
jgi:hypothetical protein